MEIITRASLKKIRYDFLIEETVEFIGEKINDYAKVGNVEYHTHLGKNLDITHDWFRPKAWYHIHKEHNNQTEDRSYIEDLLVKLNEKCPDLDIQVLETVKDGVVERTLMIKWD
jgi:hypothetical protein